MSFVPPRGDETVPQVREMLHGEVPGTQAASPSRYAWPGPAEDVGVWREAAGETKAASHLRRSGDAIQDVFPPGGKNKRCHWRAAVAVVGDAPGQRRVSVGICH